jgi:hypothetical protein
MFKAPEDQGFRAFMKLLGKLDNLGTGACSNKGAADRTVGFEDERSRTTSRVLETAERY